MTFLLRIFNSPLIIILIVGAILGGLLYYLISGDIEDLAAQMRAFGVWSVLISTAMMILSAITLFPTDMPTLLNGIMFGPLKGFALTWAGAMIGANIAFALGRIIPQAQVESYVGVDRLLKIRNWTARYGVPALLVTRMLPFMPFFVINYAASLFGVRWWTFNWTTGLGMAPPLLIVCLFGHGLVHIDDWMTGLSGIWP